jgi:hypothetical protein
LCAGGIVISTTAGQIEVALPAIAKLDEQDCIVANNNRVGTHPHIEVLRHGMCLTRAIVERSMHDGGAIRSRRTDCRSAAASALEQAFKRHDLAREAVGWNFHDRKRSLFTRETVSERTVSQKRRVGRYRIVHSRIMGVYHWQALAV